MKLVLSQSPNVHGGGNAGLPVMMAYFSMIDFGVEPWIRYIERDSPGIAMLIRVVPSSCQCRTCECPRQGQKLGMGHTFSLNLEGDERWARNEDSVPGRCQEKWNVFIPIECYQLKFQSLRQNIIPGFLRQFGASSSIVVPHLNCLHN